MSRLSARNKIERGPERKRAAELPTDHLPAAGDIDLIADDPAEHCTAAETYLVLQRQQDSAHLGALVERYLDPATLNIEQNIGSLDAVDAPDDAAHVRQLNLGVIEGKLILNIYDERRPRAASGLNDFSFT
jgi:hypothetical protein